MSSAFIYYIDIDIDRYATCHDVKHSRILTLMSFIFIYYIDIDTDINRYIKKCRIQLSLFF
jgi:hypothetical protein